MKLFKQKQPRPQNSVDISASTLYDYSNQANREATALFTFAYSRGAKSIRENMWRLYDDYYQGDHETAILLQAQMQAMDIPFELACVQDPFTHVESQITPDIPDFQFSGRDDDLDSAKAKQREYAVQFVVDNNDVNGINMRQERRLNKLGNSLYKVYWDDSIEVQGDVVGGDIKVIDVALERFYPDPSALCIDDCEYVNYYYPMHIRAANRKWKKELKKAKVILKTSSGNQDPTKIFSSQMQTPADDVIMVLEHWYRSDDNGMNCCILIQDTEIKHIENYWRITGKQNKLFPFVKVCKTQDENDFWDRSELANILELVDAADRELAYGQFNNAMMGNDIIVVEEQAMADGQAFDNVPGAKWVTKPGMINAVRRLQGLSEVSNRLQTVEGIQAQIERTVGNFDTSMGSEPVRVTTSSGIAQINERADARKNIKKADRTTGFQDLYRLIDWTCLEFYDRDRMIYIGVDNEELNKQFAESGQGMNMDKSIGPVIFKYNSKKIMDESGYFPTVDCKIIASDSVAKSKAFNIQAMQDLLKTQVTPENYKLVIAMLDLMGIANRKDIIDFYEEQFAPQNQLPPGAPNAEQINAGVQPPQQPQVDHNAMAEQIMAQLSDEERQKLAQNPQLLDELIAHGGM